MRRALWLAALLPALAHAQGFGLGFWGPAEAAAPPAGVELDGAAVNAGATGAGTTLATAASVQSTGGTGYGLVAIVRAKGNSSDVSVQSIADDKSGGTWARLVRPELVTGNDAEIWWVATPSGFTGGVVTVTWNANAVSDRRVTVLRVKGINATQNGATARRQTNTYPITTTITPTTTGSLLVFGAYDQSDYTPTANTGMTLSEGLSYNWTTFFAGYRTATVASGEVGVSTTVQPITNTGAASWDYVIAEIKP